MSESQYLTDKKIQYAEVMWIKYVQRKHYPKEYDAIAANRPTSLRRCAR